MSQISSVGTGGGGGGGIETITGDLGSITGDNVTIFANQAANNAGASVKFVNSGTVSTFNLTDVNNNTFLGQGTGNLSLIGAERNTGAGSGALNAILSGDQNVAYGNASLGSLTNGNHNNSFGGNLTNLIDGDGNVAIGDGIAGFLISGDANIFIGDDTVGDAYTTNESYNIIIQNDGVIGDNNTMRLGNQGSGTREVNRTFIAGIVGNTVSNAEFVTIDSTTGQMGVTAGAGFGSPTYFSAYRSTPQSLPGNTMTQVVFDTTIANVGSAYSTSTGFFTAPVTGFYGFSGTIMVSPIGVGITTLDLGFLGSVYGTTSFQIDSAAFATSGQYQATFSWNIPMTAGDTIGVNIYATGVASSTINGGALGATFNSQTLFSGYRIA